MPIVYVEFLCKQQKAVHSTMQAGTSMAHSPILNHLSLRKATNHPAPISNPTTQKTKQKKTNKTTQTNPSLRGNYNESLIGTKYLHPYTEGTHSLRQIRSLFGIIRLLNTKKHYVDKANF